MKTFKSFFRYFGVDIRVEEVICSLLPFGLFVYNPLINFMSDPQIISLGNTIAFGGGFLTLIISATCRSLRKKGREDYDTKEVWNLANERKIPFISNPFHITDKKKFLALTTSDKKVFLGKYYLDRLENDDEKAFVLGHESYHYNSKEVPCDIATIFLIIGIEYGIEVFTHNFLFPLVFICPFLFLFSQIHRSRESMADIHGLNFSNPNAAKIALEIRYSVKKSRMFDSHPRFKKRIESIEKQNLKL